MTSSDGRKPEPETCALPRDWAGPVRPTAGQLGELVAGMTVGDYGVDYKIASGGCGAVYAVTHRVSGRRAALKALHIALASSPKLIARFEREIDVVNLIRHPNIVAIDERGQLRDGRPYFVMELLEGTHLDALVRGTAGLPPQQVLELVEPVCAALGAAHAVGVVHRDIKGSNVLIVERNGTRLVKLADFGIAKLLDSGRHGSLTTHGAKLGTPQVMAPEQIRGAAVDARTDIYALGALLYRLLTGSFPFAGKDPLDLETKHLQAPAPRPSLVAPINPAIDAVVLRCLEKQPARRYQDVSALLEELRRAVGPSHSENRATPSSESRALGFSVALEPITPQIEDAWCDELDTALDEAERTLRDEGFVPLLQTGYSLLVTRICSGDAARARDERGRAAAIALAMHERLHRAFAGRMRTKIWLNEDGAVVAEDASGPRVVGGPIARIGVSAPERAEVSGVFATAGALDGVPDVGPIELDSVGYARLDRVQA